MILLHDNFSSDLSQVQVMGVMEDGVGGGSWVIIGSGEVGKGLPPGVLIIRIKATSTKYFDGALLQGCYTSSTSSVAGDDFTAQ